MKKIRSVCVLATLASTQVFADGQSFSPDSHAPAGIMSEHMHSAGEFMVGYRYMSTRYSGLFNGSTKIGIDDLANAGFTMAATSMTMDMTMLDFMYAPADWLTLMVMPMYMEMDMSMMPTGAAMAPGHGDHGSMPGDGHSHGISGWGDTNVSGLFRLAGGEQHQLIGTLGVNVPTGKSDLKNADGNYIHYSMQPGSGTWDLTPSLTYTGSQGIFSWGTQASALLRMESENDAGFAFGDRYQLSGWSAVRVTDWASLSLRLGWQEQAAISGHYNGPHNHNAPEDFQENNGGEFVDAGLGANFVVTGGGFAGLRLGVEWTTRLSENYNGYQLGLDKGLNVSLSYAFE